MALKTTSCISGAPAARQFSCSQCSKQNLRFPMASRPGLTVISENASDEPMDLSRYPVPVTPLTDTREIEYERALVAEAAMKSGPAISKGDVLFEDLWLLVINKPCGVYSEHVLISVPTLQGSPYCPKYPMEDKGEGFLHLANRLDRDTSGILVIAKCKVAAGKLTRMFERRELKKAYVALCAGMTPDWKTATVESGHGRSRRGCWRVYRKQDVERSLPDGSLVKDMATIFSIVNPDTNSNSLENRIITVEDEREACSCNSDHVQSDDTSTKDNDGSSTSGAWEEEGVFVRAVPLTGRTHQIRLHCQYLGLSLIGDAKYGGPLDWKGNRCGYHFLHAESISFKHPMTEEQLEVSAPHPSWAPDSIINI